VVWAKLSAMAEGARLAQDNSGPIGGVRVELAGKANAVGVVSAMAERIAASLAQESKSNFIEHPELIAQRIARYANLVGRDNVIAGTGCGFGTWVGQAAVDPDDDPWNNGLALGQLDPLEQGPFMRVARVGSLERRSRREHDINDLGERHVVMVRSLVIAPAQMQAGVRRRDRPGSLNTRCARLGNSARS
jgi:hypothetical protein